MRIIPDLPDNDVTLYLVLNDYRIGLAFVETALDEADLKTDTGFHWRIVHIELDLQPAEFGSERPIGIHVYSRDRNRAEIIQMLAGVRPRP